MKSLVAVALLANVQAFRPPEGSNPWHKAASLSTWQKPDWNVDYKVPNFGVDSDVLSTQSHIKEAEGKLEHKMKASFKKPKEHPKDYFVPNFGVDKDIVDAQESIKSLEKVHGAWNPKQDDNGVWMVPTAHENDSYTYRAVQLVQLESDPICSSAGCDQYKHPKKKDDYPKDYFVPNFGKDRDIKHNFEDLDLAEKQLKHHWEWIKTKPTDPVLYNDHKPLDPDIQDSLQNLANQEAEHGEWTLPKDEDVQLSAESDPICSSAGCTQYKHPKKELGYELDYPVPNFGQDREIKDNFNSLKIAQKIQNHTWNFELLKPPLNPAKKTLYNFAPDLDEDIKVSQTNLANSEASLDHKYDVLG